MYVMCEDRHKGLINQFTQKTTKLLIVKNIKKHKIQRNTKPYPCKYTSQPPLELSAPVERPLISLEGIRGNC